MSEDHRVSRSRSRYDPLVAHLAAQDEREVVLTFPEIEAILGVPLAPSAYVETYYWMGLTLTYVQRWRSLGWRARLDRRKRCVRFTRNTE